MAGETGYTVLVVDDHANWRNLLTQILERDCEVITVEDYDEARAAVLRQNPPFHVVVTDLRLDDRDMADEGGLALATELKQASVFTKVIVVTGYPTLETQEKAYQDLSVYKYLSKNPGGGRAFDHHALHKLVSEAAADAEAERGRFVFVLMPFAEEYQTLYESVIKKTVEKHGLPCKRADDFFQPKPIMDDVRFGIRESVFNIADFSGQNANVFYEVGLAHAMQQTALLITQSLEDVPPSLRQLRHIVYQNVPGANKLRQELGAAIEDLQRQGFSATSVFQQDNFEIDPELCLVLTASNDQACQTAYKHIVKPEVEKLGLTCKGIESVFSTGKVLDAIWHRINQASLIIADLSSRDPNVFYLTGLCDGLNKDVVFLARDAADIPFDLRERFFIIYAAGTFEDGERSKEELRVKLEQMLGESLRQ